MIVIIAMPYIQDIQTERGIPALLPESEGCNYPDPCTDWTKSVFTSESVAASSSSVVMGRGRGGGLRNARVANGNLVPWHHSAGDNLRPGMRVLSQ